MEREGLNDPGRRDDGERDAPESVPVSPQGAGPATVPDPMPDDLQRTPAADEAFEEADPMEGDAPTG